MVARSKYTVFNQALALSGQAGKEIQPGSSGPEAALLERLYPEIVAEAMEAGDFHFGKTRTTLTNRTAGDFGFEHAWDVPEDCLHIHQVFVDEYDIEDWEWIDTRLYINASENVVIEYAKTNTESRWSAAFTRGIVKKLESLIRHGINEEPEEGERADDRGDFYLIKAGTRSSKQTGPRRPFKEGFLMRSRRFGPQRYRRRGLK